MLRFRIEPINLTMCKATNFCAALVFFAINLSAQSLDKYGRNIKPTRVVVELNFSNYLVYSESSQRVYKTNIYQGGLAPRNSSFHYPIEETLELNVQYEMPLFRKAFESLGKAANLERRINGQEKLQLGSKVFEDQFELRHSAITSELKKNYVANRILKNYLTKNGEWNTTSLINKAQDNTSLVNDLKYLESTGRSIDADIATELLQKIFVQTVSVVMLDEDTYSLYSSVYQLDPKSLSDNITWGDISSLDKEFEWIFESEGVLEGVILKETLSKRFSVEYQNEVSFETQLIDIGQQIDGFGIEGYIKKTNLFSSNISLGSDDGLKPNSIIEVSNYNSRGIKKHKAFARYAGNGKIRMYQGTILKAGQSVSVKPSKNLSHQFEINNIVSSEFINVNNESTTLNSSLYGYRFHALSDDWEEGAFSPAIINGFGADLFVSFNDEIFQLGLGLNKNIPLVFGLSSNIGLDIPFTIPLFLENGDIFYGLGYRVEFQYYIYRTLSIKGGLSGQYSLSFESEVEENMGFLDWYGRYLALSYDIH